VGPGQPFRTANGTGMVRGGEGADAGGAVRGADAGRDVGQPRARVRHVGPDGLAGGSPHLHTVCTEAYLVIGGEGMVQTLSGEGYGETPLVAGTVAWFSPGTIHRLVNLDGRLELYVVMSNAGLPEAGDMVLAFEPHVVADETRYRSHADLPADALTTAGAADPAMARRDLAVTGFGHWKSAVDAEGPAALDPCARQRSASSASGPDLAVDPRRRPDTRPRVVARPGRGARRSRPARRRRRPPRRVGHPLALAAPRHPPHGLLRHPRHRRPLTESAPVADLRRSFGRRCMEHVTAG
jgi:mannose-6-phosphate isomerase-like protein (cupin superfamily)